jgi:hypothetical protein
VRLLRATAVALIATVAAVFVQSCGGGSSSTGPSSGLTCSTLPNSTTFLYLNNTICPQSMTVSRGTRITVINNDSRIHEFNSDPHPEHTDCPELNQVGHLEPGQQRDSGNLNTARRCGFHDHNNPDSRALQGSITIQ